MILRSMTPADVMPAARLMAASALWQRYGVTQEAAARRFLSGLESQATIAVAEIEGQIAGFIWYERRGAFQRSGYIMLVGVQEEQRSRGIGKALLNYAEADMFSEVRDVFLLVSDFNEAAQRFYQRQGYTQVGALPDYVLAGITELLYRKRLSGPDASPRARIPQTSEVLTSEIFSAVDEAMRAAVGTVFPAAVLLVAWRGETVFHQAYGFLDPESRSRPTRLETRFDLASLTKLFTSTVFMRLVEEGKVSLETPVGEVVEEFCGRRQIGPTEDPLRKVCIPTDSRYAGQQVDLAQVTFRRLLTHTSGLAAWRSVYKACPSSVGASPSTACPSSVGVGAGPGSGGIGVEIPLPHQVSPAARQARIAAVAGYDFAYPVGEGLVYSDLGLILLGEAVSRLALGVSGLALGVSGLAGGALEQCIETNLAQPLGLERTGFNPLSKGVSGQDIAPTEICAWRGRRLLGEVDDENAASLGGVSGHAGLFATAEDVARLGAIFVGARLPLPSRQVLAPESVAEMRRLQVERDGLRRGLAWVLWTPDCAGGQLFSPASFGHTGFTGTSLWIDPLRELMVVLLTNRVYYGRQAVEIMQFRPYLHDLVVEAIQRN